MAVLHIVHRAFTTVLFDLFVDAVRHIGFLQQGVSNVLFIGQDIVDDGGRPAENSVQFKRPKRNAENDSEPALPMDIPKTRKQKS